MARGIEPGPEGSAVAAVRGVLDEPQLRDAVCSPRTTSPVRSRLPSLTAMISWRMPAARTAADTRTRVAAIDDSSLYTGITIDSAGTTFPAGAVGAAWGAGPLGAMTLTVFPETRREQDNQVDERVEVAAVHDFDRRVRVTPRPGNRHDHAAVPC